MKSPKPVFEFLLWDNCNNKCDFCFLKDNKRLTLEEQKTSIDSVIKFINSNKFERGSHVLILGGEIFDSPKITPFLIPLIDFILSKMKENVIDLFYVNTNLIYKNLDVIYHLLGKAKELELLQRIKFTTSYDLRGRFNQKTEKLMLDNLDKIKTFFNDCNIVVNTILSNEVCDSILSGKFSVLEFSEKHRVYVNLIPYIVLLPNLSASKNKIVKTLMYVENEIPNYLTYYMHNLNINQKKNVYKFNSEINDFVYVSSSNSECGHSENFKKYANDGNCFICDMNTVFKDFLC